MSYSEWLPKSVLCLKNYTPQKFFSDLLAGVTVGLSSLLRARPESLGTSALALAV